MVIIPDKEKNRRKEQSLTVKQEYLRAKDVAVMMSVGLSTVWAMRKQKRITAYKISEKITLFKREEIEALMDSCKVEVL